jgi:hypothetical protein
LEQIEENVHDKQNLPKTFIELSQSIPYHDTIRRLSIRLDSKAFQKFSMEWIRSAIEAMTGEVVTIDGKTFRRFHDNGLVKNRFTWSVPGYPK